MARGNAGGRLEEAMVLLVNNEASFLAHLAKSDERFALMDQRLEERFAAIDQRFARMEAELIEIKRILLRHEQMLPALPEAIRQKISFETH